MIDLDEDPPRMWKVFTGARCVQLTAMGKPCKAKVKGFIDDKAYCAMHIGLLRGNKPRKPKGSN